MSTELKPCPFDRAHPVRLADEPGKSHRWYGVGCNEWACPAALRAQVHDSEAAAIAAWNRRAATPAQPVEGWRPIETAPKQAGRVLLAWDGDVAEGFWQGDPALNYWGCVGWYAVDDDILCRRSIPPTHWQPLPAAPQAAPTECSSVPVGAEWDAFTRRHQGHVGCEVPGEFDNSAPTEEAP